MLSPVKICSKLNFSLQAKAGAVKNGPRFFALFHTSLICYQ